MSLSILCVTNNAHRDTAWFICNMQRLARLCGAEFVLGLDRAAAQGASWRALADKAIDLTCDKLQEEALDQMVDACSGDWVLRLDDDEKASPALEKWLQDEGYLKANRPLYAFPRVYLWGDARHVLTNPGMYPDLQTRLGHKDLMRGYTYVHAGNPNGTGAVVPYAIEHHNLLVKSEAERRAILARYESLRPGAGTRPEYARYNVPEMFYDQMTVKEYTDGDFTAR